MGFDPSGDLTHDEGSCPRSPTGLQTCSMAGRPSGLDRPRSHRPHPPIRPAVHPPARRRTPPHKVPGGRKVLEVRQGCRSGPLDGRGPAPPTAKSTTGRHPQPTPRHHAGLGQFGAGKPGRRLAVFPCSSIQRTMAGPHPALGGSFLPRSRLPAHGNPLCRRIHDSPNGSQTYHCPPRWRVNGPVHLFAWMTNLPSLRPLRPKERSSIRIRSACWLLPPCGQAGRGSTYAGARGRAPMKPQGKQPEWVARGEPFRMRQPTRRLGWRGPSSSWVPPPAGQADHHGLTLSEGPSQKREHHTYSRLRGVRGTRPPTNRPGIGPRAARPHIAAEFQEGRPQAPAGSRTGISRFGDPPASEGTLQSPRVGPAGGRPEP